jgi:TPR repeat protein
MRRGVALIQAERDEEAFLLFEMAAELGHAVAQYLAASMLEAGSGTVQDLPRARELYFSAAELGGDVPNSVERMR